MMKCLSNYQFDEVVNSAHWQAISVVIGQFLLVFFSLLSKHLSSELVKKIWTTANVLPRLTQISKLTQNTSTKKSKYFFLLSKHPYWIIFFDISGNEYIIEKFHKLYFITQAESAKFWDQPISTYWVKLE